MRGKQQYDRVYVTRDRFGNEMFHPPGELPPSMLKRAKTYAVSAVEPVPVAAPVPLLDAREQKHPDGA
eukprot:3519356-Amphidinium_carterae.1